MKTLYQKQAITTIAVKLEVTIPYLLRNQEQDLLATTYAACPCCNELNGNVDVKLILL